jgi:hypothetical protein
MLLFDDQSKLVAIDQQEGAFSVSLDTNQTNDEGDDQVVGPIRVRIGHIGALPYEDRILNISRDSLIAEGLLGDDLEFEYGLLSMLNFKQTLLQNYLAYGLRRIVRRCRRRGRYVPCAACACIYRTLL